MSSLQMLRMRIFQINRPIINIRLSHLTFIQTTSKNFPLRYKTIPQFKVSEEKWVVRKRLKGLINLFKTLESRRGNLMMQTWSLAEEKIYNKSFNLKQNKKQFCWQVWKVLTQKTRLLCKSFQIKKKWMKSLCLDLRTQ
jgi:hypothetical protein